MRLLDACSREPVDATPVWVMRPAGRYLPEYRAMREKHRSSKCAGPRSSPPRSRCSPYALRPRRGDPLRRHPASARAMGIALGFRRGGRARDPPARPRARRPRGVRVIDPQRVLPYLLDTLRMVRREIEGKIALIGFAGAPFTLASYLIEGGRSRHYPTQGLMFASRRRSPADGAARRRSPPSSSHRSRPGHRRCSSSIRGWAASRRTTTSRFVLPHGAHRDRSLPVPAPVIHFANGTSPCCPGAPSAGGDVYRRRLAHRPRRGLGEFGDARRAGQPRPGGAAWPAPAIEAAPRTFLRRAGGRTRPHLQPRPRPPPRGPARRRPGARRLRPPIHPRSDAVRNHARPGEHHASDGASCSWLTARPRASTRHPAFLANIRPPGRPTPYPRVLSRK